MQSSRSKKFISVIAVAFLIALFMRLFVVEGFVVSGDSMAPTIQSGDYVLVNKLAYLRSTPQKGDIVVATPREYRGKVIKRVVGLPGETLPSGATSTYKLDPQEYYLEGDNRDVSIDSRELGGIDAWSISGKVFGVLRIKSLKYIGF